MPRLEFLPLPPKPTFPPLSLDHYHAMASTDSILKGKYPAKDHARRVASYLQKAGHPKEGIIYLESQKTRLIEDNDEPVPFR
jgi:hypothetical protein